MKTKKQITKEILGVLEDFELTPQENNSSLVNDSVLGIWDQEHVLVEDEVKRILDRMRDKKEMDMFNDPTWNWSGLQQTKINHIMETFLAPVKTKKEFFLKLVKRVVRPDYTMNIMEDRNGRKAMFYNYKGEQFFQDECVLLTATVAEHRISRYDNGASLTYLNRVTIIKNMGSVEKSS